MEILIGRDADEDVLAMLVDGKRMKDSKQPVPIVSAVLNQMNILHIAVLA